MNQNNLWQKLINIALVLALGACNTPRIPQVDQRVTRETGSHITATPLTVAKSNAKWLDQTTCRLPCFAWQIPGLTTFTEAQKFESSETSIEFVEPPGISPAMGRSWMLWRWKDVSEHIELSFLEITQTAKLALIRPTLIQTMTLAELISEYGEPTHVVVSAGDSSPGRPNLYSLSYVYLNYGVAIHMDATFAPKKPTISRESKFNMLDIFEPSKEGYQNATGMAMETIDQLLIKWQGFRDFDFYCPQAYPKEPDRCKQ
jgi:hypothetical protein